MHFHEENNYFVLAKHIFFLNLFNRNYVEIRFIKASEIKLKSFHFMLTINRAKRNATVCI